VEGESQKNSHFLRVPPCLFPVYIHAAVMRAMRQGRVGSVTCRVEPRADVKMCESAMPGKEKKRSMVYRRVITGKGNLGPRRLYTHKVYISNQQG
jgi:hypothetical protein